MNIAQQLLVKTLQQYGSVRSDWPLWRRFLLSVFILLNGSCRREWHTAQAKARSTDLALAKRYDDGVADVTVSDALQRRLYAITAMPQRGAEHHQAKAAVAIKVSMPFWQVSFASALASVLLGVALGAGGYIDELSDADTAYLESAMTYEVSDWLAGDSL